MDVVPEFYATAGSTRYVNGMRTVTSMPWGPLGMSKAISRVPERALLWAFVALMLVAAGRLMLT